MRRRLVPAWLTMALLSGGCDDYILPQAEVAVGRVDTILALTADAGAGEAVFDQHCGVCHVKTGDVASAGPALGSLVPDRDDRALVAVILEGLGTMPAVALEDQPTADVVAWMRATFDGAGAGDTDPDTDGGSDTDGGADSDTDTDA